MFKKGNTDNGSLERDVLSDYEYEFGNVNEEVFEIPNAEEYKVKIEMD